MIKLLLQILFLPFPWFIRRLIYKSMGFKIGKNAHIGFSIIRAKDVEMSDGSSIGSANYVGEIDNLYLGENSTIGSMNWITGFSVNDNQIINKGHFKHIIDRKCCLIIKNESAITSRHYIDCNGGIFIGSFVTVAGTNTQILTHSIDLKEGRQDAAPVIIGDYTFVSTRCTILKGSVLPDKSVLGACSLYNSINDVSGLYAGIPAKFIKNISDYEYFKRESGFVI